MSTKLCAYCGHKLEPKTGAQQADAQCDTCRLLLSNNRRAWFGAPTYVDAW